MFTAKRRRGRLSTAAMLSAAALALIACTNPITATPGKITGTISDAVSGGGISGASFMIGSYSATTDGSGNFSVSLPSGVTTVSGDLAVSAGAGYDFLFQQGASIDVTGGVAGFDLPLQPVSTSSDPTVTLSGTAAYRNGNPLASGDQIELFIYGQNGATNTLLATYGSSGYRLTTPTFGSDCFVVVTLIPAGGSGAESYYLANIDLSSSQTLPLDAPQSGYITVSGSGAAYGTGTTFDNVTAGIDVPGFPLISVSQVDATASNFSLTLYDPDHYPVVWLQLASSSDRTAVTSTTEIEVSDQMTPPSSPSWSVSLAPFSVAVPSSADDVSGASYNNGTLSFTPSTDAMGSLVMLEDQSSGNLVGYLWMTGGSVTLPSSIQSILQHEISSKSTGWTITASAADTEGFGPGELAGSFAGQSPPLGSQSALFDGPKSVNLSFTP